MATNVLWVLNSFRGPGRVRPSDGPLQTPSVEGTAVRDRQSQAQTAFPSVSHASPAKDLISPHLRLPLPRTGIYHGHLQSWRSAWGTHQGGGHCHQTEKRP